MTDAEKQELLAEWDKDYQAGLDALEEALQLTQRQAAEIARPEKLVDSPPTTP
ncbi:MAG TPA: hypothetical protein VIY48_08470 [Candidatus Paceibacterota bacterium]